MSYHHINDELPDEFGLGSEFYEDIRANLNDIWRKMVYGESIMYRETQVNDITSDAADTGTVGVYITDGSAPGWDMVEHILAEEFCPRTIIYRRKIDYWSESSTFEYIRKTFVWSQDNGFSYKRLEGVQFDFSLGGVDYTEIGYAALEYEDEIDHRLSELTWTLPDISQYWYYQDGKPISSDTVVQVFYDIKKNISALRDMQVFGGVIGWDNNNTQGEYQPLVPFVPGWNMTTILKSKSTDLDPNPDVYPAQSVSRINMTNSATNEVIRADFTWSYTSVDAITAISYDYSSNGSTFYSTHNVSLTYESTAIRAVTGNIHTIFTASYDHYDPDKPYDGPGFEVILAIQKNMQALLHCRLFGGGQGHTWVSDDPHYTETFPILTNVPYWQISGISYYVTVNEIKRINYKHKINTDWELNRFNDYQSKKCFYYYTESAIDENDNTKIAESKYSLMTDLAIAKTMARCALRGECIPVSYDNSTWILYDDTWLDTAAPSGNDMHIVANDQHDLLLWAGHNNCTPAYNANAITTEWISITGIDTLMVILTNASSGTRGNWITKDASENCISGESFTYPGTTYITRGTDFQSDATHIMICYTFEYENEILEVYNADAL